MEENNKILKVLESIGLSNKLSDNQKKLLKEHEETIEGLLLEFSSIPEQLQTIADRLDVLILSNLCGSLSQTLINDEGAPVLDEGGQLTPMINIERSAKYVSLIYKAVNEMRGIEDLDEELSEDGEETQE